jgi:hypothetical protein
VEKIIKRLRSKHFKLIAVSMTITAWLSLLLYYSDRLAQIAERSMRSYIS